MSNLQTAHHWNTMLYEVVNLSPVDIMKQSLDVLLSGMTYEELDITLTLLLKRTKCLIYDR